MLKRPNTLRYNIWCFALDPYQIRAYFIFTRVSLNNDDRDVEPPFLADLTQAANNSSSPKLRIISQHFAGSEILFLESHTMAIAPNLYFTQDFATQLDGLLILICEELQLTEARYRQAEERYRAVNKYLEAERSPFYAFQPEIYPQGSMALNTTVKPIDGQHDLDFVLQLAVSHDHVDPIKLLKSLHLYLLESDIYGPMTSLKNRCVRVEYSNEFYMDILIGCKNFALGGTCIKVPDRKRSGWKDSNPRGYIKWFKEDRSSLYLAERMIALERAEPIPNQQSVPEKNPLQLAVQLLKRERDIRYGASPLAPISIVLTTLAADTYAGEQSVSKALTRILNGISEEIARADSRSDRLRVHNPSNLAEDLSERWDENPKAYWAFREGMIDLQQKWSAILNKKGDVSAALEKLFGETVKNATMRQAQRLQEDRRQGRLGVSSSGLIGLVSATTRKTPVNTFYGEE